MSSIIVGRPATLASSATFSTLLAPLTDAIVGINSTDGADSGRLTISGGPSLSTDRGSFIAVHGNEHASAPGRVRLRGGNVSGGGMVYISSGNDSAAEVQLQVDDIRCWYLNNSGHFNADATYGGHIVFNKTSAANVIRLGTSDAADSGRLVVAGGGASNTSGTRGSEIHYLGNEVSGGVGGSLQMYTGNVSSGFISKDINSASGYELTRIGGNDRFRIANTLITAACVINYTATMGNSTKNPTADAPADWVECQIGGTTYYLPAYAA